MRLIGAFFFEATAVIFTNGEEPQAHIVYGNEEARAVLDGCEAEESGSLLDSVFELFAARTSPLPETSVRTTEFHHGSYVQEMHELLMSIEALKALNSAKLEVRLVKNDVVFLFLPNNGSGREALFGYADSDANHRVTACFSKAQALAVLRWQMRMPTAKRVAYVKLIQESTLPTSVDRTEQHITGTLAAVLTTAYIEQRERRATQH